MGFFDKLSGKGRRSAEEWWQEGRAFVAGGNYDQGIVCYNNALALDPADATNYLDRGAAYLFKGDPDAAIADFTRFIAIGSKQGWGAAPAGQSAAGLLDDLPQRKDLAMAYANRGGAHLWKGNSDAAIADYTEAVRLNPSLAFAYSNRGTAYAGKQNYPRAIADYTEAIRLEPNPAGNVNAYEQRAKAYRALGDEDNAAKDERRTSAWDYFARGEAHFAKGEAEQGIADHSEAIRLDPTWLRYVARARGYETLRDYDRAIGDYTEAIRLSPQDGMLYLVRASLYRCKGDEALAAADERKIEDLRK